jgi:uncharacterized membrane protein YhhN
VFFAWGTAACVAALLAAEYRASRVGVWLAKPAAAFCFVAAAISWGALDSHYGAVVLAGLALSLCGDVLLIPHDRPRVFQAGMAAFGLGHVAYLVAFALRFESVVRACLCAAIVVILLARILPWLRPHLPANMKTPVHAYMGVISLMLIAAAGASPSDPRILIGAALFYFSDLAVARDRFVSISFANRVWGLPLYFSAQVVIASTVRSL